MPVSLYYLHIFTNNLNFNIMATQAIDATIFASSHPDIAKRTSISGLLISCVMLLIGILSFASTFELEDKSSTVSMALIGLWNRIVPFRYIPAFLEVKRSGLCTDRKHSERA